MLIGIDGLADLLGERHRIIANDWQAAHMNTLTSRLPDRAADILEQIDFTHKALRDDLVGQKISPGRLYSAAELKSHAADLCSDSAGLVDDNERRSRASDGRHRGDGAKGMCAFRPGLPVRPRGSPCRGRASGVRIAPISCREHVDEDPGWDFLP